MLEFSYQSDAEGVVMWDDENKDNKTCYLKMFSKNTPRSFSVAAHNWFCLPGNPSTEKGFLLVRFAYDSLLCHKVSLLNNKLYLRSSFERTKSKTGKVTEKLCKECSKI